MTSKWIGAALVVTGCAGVGFSMAANHRKEESQLLQLIHALDLMRCELEYHLTPLPQLCRESAMETSGMVKTVFLSLAEELEEQISPDASSCMCAVLAPLQDVSKCMRDLFRELGFCLGRFDLPGQLQGLETVRTSASRELELLRENKDSRIRSYQTLGLCAGAALAILFI